MNNCTVGLVFHRIACKKKSFSEHVEQMYEIPALMWKNGMDKFLLEHLNVMILYALLF
jgi:hypothetical protein